MLQPWQVDKARSMLASRLTLVESGCHLFVLRLEASRQADQQPTTPKENS